MVHQRNCIPLRCCTCMRFKVYTFHSTYIYATKHEEYRFHTRNNNDINNNFRQHFSTTETNLSMHTMKNAGRHNNFSESWAILQICLGARKQFRPTDFKECHKCGSLDLIWNWFRKENRWEGCENLFPWMLGKIDAALTGSSYFRTIRRIPGTLVGTPTDFILLTSLLSRPYLCWLGANKLCLFTQDIPARVYKPWKLDPLALSRNLWVLCLLGCCVYGVSTWQIM